MGIQIFFCDKFKHKYWQTRLTYFIKVLVSSQQDKLPSYYKTTSCSLCPGSLKTPDATHFCYYWKKNKKFHIVLHIFNLLLNSHRIMYLAWLSPCILPLGGQMKEIICRSECNECNGKRDYSLDLVGCYECAALITIFMSKTLNEGIPSHLEGYHPHKKSILFLSICID